MRACAANFNGIIHINILKSLVCQILHPVFQTQKKKRLSLLPQFILCAGAVGSATSALLADLTRIEQRTKAMAIIGITIGTAFSAAMVLGPLLTSYFSGFFLFWLSALFGVLAILILQFGIPTIKKVSLP